MLFSYPEEHLAKSNEQEEDDQFLRLADRHISFKCT